MRRSLRPWTLLLLFLPGCASAPQRVYTDLAERKSKLPPVAVAADIVVVRDIAGSSEAVLIDRSLHFADAALSLVATGLKARGYSVGTQCTASIGQMLDPAIGWIVRDSLEHEATVEQVPGGPPPFHLDEALRRDSETPGRWATLVRTLWESPPRERGAKAQRVAAAEYLQGALGGEVAAIVTGFAWNRPRHRRSPLAASQSGYAAWRSSNAVIQLSIVDTATGEILWSDERVTRRALDDRQLASMLTDLLRRMP